MNLAMFCSREVAANVNKYKKNNISGISARVPLINAHYTFLNCKGLEAVAASSYLVACTVTDRFFRHRQNCRSVSILGQSRKKERTLPVLRWQQHGKLFWAFARSCVSCNNIFMQVMYFLFTLFLDLCVLFGTAVTWSADVACDTDDTPLEPITLVYFSKAFR